MRKTIKLLLLLVMTIVVQGAWGQDPTPQEPSGEGTMENPYMIEYWKCEDCGLCWSSEACDDEHLIPEDATIIQGSVHNHVLVEAKSATCQEYGWKEHYICDNCGMLFVKNNRDGFSEKGYDMEESGLIIPAKAHTLDENGVCVVCGEKYLLKDGENKIIFPDGKIRMTIFKYTATQAKLLNVTVETDADILDQIVMHWSEWEEMQGGGDNDDRPASVRRRAGARNMEPLMVHKVKKGNVYAIGFLTAAETDTEATITLSYSEYPEVKVGTNTVRIESTQGYEETDPAHYNIFKFVAPATGTAHFYTAGDEDTSGKLFDSNMSSIKNSQDDIDYDNRNWNFVIDYEVTEGETYYIGARQYSGYSIDEYSLVIEIDGYTPPAEFEGTLVLGDSKSLAETLGRWKEIDMFTATSGVTYKRNSTTSRWGTVILPYELESNNEVTYYRLSQVGEAAEGETAVMTFLPVETVAPNTPTVYRFNNEARNYQYDASTAEPTTVVVPRDDKWLETSVESLPDWTMCGFYAQHVISSNDLIQNYRYISKDKFMTATNSLTVNPYRAVFRVGRAASAKTFVIAIADGGTTSIQAVATANGVEEVIGIYDINGRQLNTMQRGVNIIRTADGKTHKIINK